ncbi:hypothetical protein GCM10027446_15180 [Angustibacter peucedani]
MILRRKPAPVLSLWCVVGPRELQALIEVGWTSWPQLDPADHHVEAFSVRAEAVHVVRDELVLVEGEGSVVVFDVPDDVASWPGVEQRGDRLLIPKGRRLTKAIVGDISEEAQYQRGASAPEVDAVRDAFGELVPEAWRDMVQAPGWLRRGWMATGAYVDLHPPADAIRVTQDWTREMLYHPGVLLIGSDGADRRLAIDLREDDPPVRSLDPASTGWDDTVVQSGSVRAFADQLEVGDFAYVG